MKKSPLTATKLAELIAAFGTRVCFGVLGSANFQITQALSDNGVRYVAARHESTAVMMAYGYSCTKGELAIASVHSGPGLTNAITAIAEAAKGRIPLLILAGDVAADDLGSNFHFDQAAMVKSVGAVAERIYTAESAVNDLLRAVRKVVRDRKTVVLSLPEDVQNAPFVADEDFHQAKLLLATRSFELPRVVPDPAMIKNLADAVERSERPLILAGRGAALANAKQSLLNLGSQIGGLLATSLAVHGFFAGEEWSVGISGGFAAPAALELIPQSDLILGFGVSFTQWTTKAGRLINPRALTAQIDSDSGFLGFNRPVTFPVLGDAQLTARALSEELRVRGLNQRSGWRSASTKAVILKGARAPAGNNVNNGPSYVDPRQVSLEIDKILPSHRLIVTDSGHFMGWSALYFATPDEKGWCVPTAFMCVGLALGCAIGAAVAEPERLTIVAVGDGGMMMSMSDLATAVGLRLKIVIVVYNDSAYGAEVHYFRHRGYNTDIVRFPEEDFAAIAKGQGAQSTVVRTIGDLSELAEWARRGANGTFVVDARVDPNVEADWFKDLFAEHVLPSAEHAASG